MGLELSEKRAEEKSGLNCDIDYAKSSFKQTRALYGKENGVQAHTVIQSFKPGEVTPEQCNQLGLELSEKRAEEKSGLNCDIDYAKSSFK
ncbi:relaxase/mobilization nuclease domain-containing protein, partial [Staphylococcus aureus]|uniref:relaxase/mobilization nuclease domain-containing protein n=1 Tax=Staphylococcus aureus TaxID=1280 RepID=UPI00210E7B8C